jgi:hypothetical protein
MAKEEEGAGQLKSEFYTCPNIALTAQKSLCELGVSIPTFIPTRAIFQR